MDSTPAFATQLHPSRLRAAMATPSSWVDATVESIEAIEAMESVETTEASSDAALIVLRDLDGRVHRIRAEYLGNDNRVQPGEPASLHPVFGVLALGGRFVRAA